eukprot:2641471-Ditylum_brightwellii.AAC.1
MAFGTDWSAMFVFLNVENAHGGDGFRGAFVMEVAVFLDGDFLVCAKLDQAIEFLHVGLMPYGAVRKCGHKGFEEGVGTGT